MHIMQNQLQYLIYDDKHSMKHEMSYILKIKQMSRGYEFYIFTLNMHFRRLFNGFKRMTLTANFIATLHGMK